MRYSFRHKRVKAHVSFFRAAVFVYVFVAFHGFGEFNPASENGLIFLPSNRMLGNRKQTKTDMREKRPSTFARKRGAKIKLV